MNEKDLIIGEIYGGELRELGPEHFRNKVYKECELTNDGVAVFDENNEVKGFSYTHEREYNEQENVIQREEIMYEVYDIFSINPARKRRGFFRLHYYITKDIVDDLSATDWTYKYYIGDEIFELTEYFDETFDSKRFFYKGLFFNGKLDDDGLAQGFAICFQLGEKNGDLPYIMCNFVDGKMHGFAFFFTDNKEGNFVFRDIALFNHGKRVDAFKEQIELTKECIKNVDKNEW